MMQGGQKVTGYSVSRFENVEHGDMPTMLRWAAFKKEYIFESYIK